MMKIQVLNEKAAVMKILIKKVTIQLQGNWNWDNPSFTHQEPIIRIM